MKTIFVMFGATRYWEADALARAGEQVKAEVGALADDVLLVVDGVVDESALQAKLSAYDTCVIIPMSGAVQAPLVEFAKRCGRVILFAGYVAGNFSEALCRDMLRLNAAPTLMDTWAVLKRTHPNVLLCVDRASLKDRLETAEAAKALSKANVSQTAAAKAAQMETILLIGDVEPWVVSASRDYSAYEQAGMRVEQVSADVLEALYIEVTAEEAAPTTQRFTENADSCNEPTAEDIEKASRLAIALERLLARHEAVGAAIACFNLIPRLGTTSCLAVSHINENTKYIAACEGDLDSAVTMRLMKRVTDKGLWMANPNLQMNGTVNFTHCTAPLSICGTECRFCLRNHHESGAGVSPQVSFPIGGRVTLCRFSAAEGKLTVQGGVSEDGAREESCRTQLRVRPDNFVQYIETALGCHQVIAFEDVCAEMRAVGHSLGLAVE